MQGKRAIFKGQPGLEAARRQSMLNRYVLGIMLGIGLAMPRPGGPDAQQQIDRLRAKKQ